MRPRVTWPPGDSVFLTRGAEGARVGDRSGRRQGELRLHVLTRGSLEVKGKEGEEVSERQEDREEMSSRRLVARFSIDKVT